MPVCNVCVSPYAPIINADLIAGVGGNTIQKRFPSVSLNSIKRHRASGHHDRAIRALAVAVPAEKMAILGENAALNAATIIEKSASLLTRAEAYLAKAEVSGDLNSMGKAVAAVDRSLRLAAELMGLFPKTATVDARSVTVNAITGLSTDDLRRLIALPGPTDG
jgi:hypothetical protein